MKTVAGASVAAVVVSCSETALTDGPSLVALYSQDRTIVAGLESQRIPFGVLETTTHIIVDNTEIPISIMKEGQLIDELTVSAHIVHHDHVASDADDGHSHSQVNRYFPLRANLAEPGIYDIVANIGGFEAVLAVQAFDKSEVKGLIPGEQFPEVLTPTEIDKAGVDTICTRNPECGLHTVSAGQVLGKKPFALLIATPELCATAYCGPVLETLLNVRNDYPDIELIHGEVYANVAEVGGNYADPSIEVASHVKKLDLDFEPALYFVNAEGKLLDRLDNIFDEKELRSELDALL